MVIILCTQSVMYFEPHQFRFIYPYVTDRVADPEFGKARTRIPFWSEYPYLKSLYHPTILPSNPITHSHIYIRIWKIKQCRSRSATLAVNHSYTQGGHSLGAKPLYVSDHPVLTPSETSYLF